MATKICRIFSNHGLDADLKSITDVTHSDGKFLKSNGTKFVLDNPTATDLTKTSDNMTIDAQGNNTNIVFKGTKDTVDITFLTLTGSTQTLLLKEI